MSIILPNTHFIQPQHFFKQLISSLSQKPYGDEDIIETFKTIKDAVSKELPVLYSQYLEQLDDEYCRSEYRKNNYIVKDIRERTVLTSFGELKFKRRIYIHRSSARRFYYIDNVIKIRKYQRILDEFIFKMIEELIAERMSYQSVASRHQVSRTTIYNAINNIDLSQHIGCRVSPFPSNQIYIQADEHYISQQKQKIRSKFMIKQVTLFSSTEKTCKNRTKLLDRIVLTQHIEENNQSFYTRILDIVGLINPTKNPPRIITKGDGAPWIKTLAQWIGSEFYIDGFQFKKAMRSLCPKGLKSVTPYLVNYLENNQIEALRQCLLAMHEKTQMSDLPQEIVKTYRYVTKHRIGYFKSKQLNLPGCSAEGMVSHYLASQLTRHPKAFKPSNAYTLAQLMSLHHNGIKITELFKDNSEYYYHPAMTPIYGAQHYESFSTQPSRLYKSNYNSNPTLEKELSRS